MAKNNFQTPGDRELLLARIDEKDKRIVELEQLLKTEQGRVRAERTRFFRLESFVRTYPRDQSYIAYLRSELKSCEEVCAQNQMVIENYREHHKKYGTFYRDWEDLREKMIAELRVAGAQTIEEAPEIVSNIEILEKEISD